MLDLLKWVFWLSVFAIVYSYSLYPLLLVIFSRLFGKPVKKDSSFTPTVGVLIPVHNEEEVIRKKIENILSLNYPEDKLSIWVGSDKSTDRIEEFRSGFNNPRSLCALRFVRPKPGF